MRQRYGFVVAVVTLVCLLWAGPALAAKRYSAERFDVVLDVQSGGAVVVTETIRFRFEGGPFIFAFRDLAYAEIDEIDRLQASMDGAILPQGTGPGQVEVVAGRPLKVTWHLAATSDSVHEFVLTYRVQGAIRKEAGADALIWRAIPEDHDYEIEHSTITLRYPASSPLLGTPKLSGAAASQESGDGLVQWAAAGIDADESLVVTARFAPDSLVKAAPAWQSRQADRQQQRARAIRTGLTTGLLTLAVGLVALATFLLRKRRTGLSGSARFVQVSTPPDQTRPGLAVRLGGRGTPALATLYDLAGRGLVRIAESGKGLLGGKKYTLERLPSDTELRPHEEGLLRVLFAEKGGGELDSLPLSQVARRLANREKWYREPLEQELADAGWIDPRRKATRKRLMAATVVLFLGGAALMIAGLLIGGSSAAQDAAPGLPLSAVTVGAGGALFLVALVALVAGALFSPLSEQGEQAAALWKSFGAYLKGIVRGREFVAGDALFERYLPFAAGWGLGEPWAKHFQKQGYTAIPAWFGSLEADDVDFSGVVAVLATINASVSSAGGGASGAGGASGGGASGAG